MQSKSIVIFIATILVVVAVQHSEARYQPFMELRGNENEPIEFSFDERQEQTPVCGKSACCTDECVPCRSPKSDRTLHCRHISSFGTYVGFDSASSCKKGVVLASAVVGFARSSTDLCSTGNTQT
ncbi:hypothetical protein I4U23_016162 [Adineta vaga]|nr:hypothetical protein I4U23_016162 [Adineta vaga]